MSVEVSPFVRDTIGKLTFFLFNGTPLFFLLTAATIALYFQTAKNTSLKHAVRATSSPGPGVAWIIAHHSHECRSRSCRTTSPESAKSEWQLCRLCRRYLGSRFQRCAAEGRPDLKGPSLMIHVPTPCCFVAGQPLDVLV
jgi:hypothetical protein